jgi:hypothetical protein
MKKLVTVTEVVGEGLESLLGENVMFFCVNYIYAGKLTGVNQLCVILEDAKIVYETGAFTEKGFKDAQKLPGKEWGIERAMIESWGVSK